VNIVILTNDNFFSYTVLKPFFQIKKDDIKLVIFSSALIGRKGFLSSIKWSIQNTGLRHTAFKTMTYGVFKALRILCTLLSFIPNNYSSYLWIRRNNIEFTKTSNVNDTDVIALIKKNNPDLIISVSMNQIVKKEILEFPPLRCINVHCAPLPRYGGMSPYVWALAHNEDHSAATIHYMEEGLDVGDIIVQDKIKVVKNDSAFSLFYRCCLRAADLLIQVVKDIDTQTVKSYTQDLTQKTYFSWPTKQCIKDLKTNGFSLAKITDFSHAIFRQKPRVK